jgi:hypothetical protein
MGLLEYERYTEKIATRIRVRVSHYMGEDEDAHLLSVFGNDSDVGAISAAVYEKARFRQTFPGGETQEISLAEGAICCRESISTSARKHSVRRMITLCEELRGVKSLSRTFVLRPEPTEVWTALVHRFGLPGLPEWAKGMTHLLVAKGRITRGQHRVFGRRDFCDLRGIAGVDGKWSWRRGAVISRVEWPHSMVQRVTRGGIAT